jgi:hypothetical protein
VALERHWFANYLSRLSNNWLDQTIGTVAAPVQNLDGILISIKKDEEVVMPK